MKLTPYKPRTKQEFWCNSCDAVTVASDAPDTGSFYIQYGHCFKQTEMEYSGEYVGVMFALCADCIKRGAE